MTLGDDPTLDGSEEEFCEYCGEPLEDGLCSASCSESAADEGREISSLPNETECVACSHMREMHIEYTGECCECDCQAFKEPE